MTTAAELLNYAKQFIGTPYVWGGTSPNGMDCSGFVVYVYHHFGIDLPRTSQEQAKEGTTVPKNALMPGDLLFYNYEGPDSHVTIYYGNGKQIGARHTGVPLEITNVDWSSFTHAQRIVDLNGNPLTGGSDSGSSDPSGPQYTYNKDTCAWGMDFPSTGLFGIKVGGGGFCVISKTEARALLGGLLVAGGAFMMLFGAAALIAYGLKSTKAMDAVTQTAGIVPGLAKATSAGNAATKRSVSRSSSAQTAKHKAKARVKISKQREKTKVKIAKQREKTKVEVAKQRAKAKAAKTEGEK